MDNPQIRLSDENEALAWLAGIIDADGCVHFMTRKRKDAVCRTPAIDIATINPATAEIINLVASQYGSMCWFMRPHNTLQAIRISGIGRCTRILEKLIPYMVTKQKEAELMLQWCRLRSKKTATLRFSKGNHKDRSGESVYTEDEESLVAEVKRLKSDRNLRDYMPSPRWLSRGEDIVRASVRAEEAGGNDLPARQSA